MCLICIDLAKGKLSTEEARKNLKEIEESMPEHVTAVYDAIWDKELEELLDK
jgi:hypothetical protein